MSSLLQLASITEYIVFPSFFAFSMDVFMWSLKHAFLLVILIPRYFISSAIFVPDISCGICSCFLLYISTLLFCLLRAKPQVAAMFSNFCIQVWAPVTECVRIKPSSAYERAGMWKCSFFNPFWFSSSSLINKYVFIRKKTVDPLHPSLIPLLTVLSTCFSWFRYKQLCHDCRCGR